MALSKQVVIDKIEILRDGLIQVRQSVEISDDGNYLTNFYNRYILEPGADITSQPLRIRQICNVVWTQAIIDAYKTAKGT